MTCVNSENFKTKDISLEALRGLAALVVVFWHLVLAFTPEYSGVLPNVTDKSFRNTPLFVLINGTAAVYLFFVLSGYVLTRKYFLQADPNYLIRGLLKRWPRLLLPVLISVVVSWCLFHWGFYFYEFAARLSGSTWLARFGNTSLDPSAVRFLDAFYQGVFFVFFAGEFSYNSSLWTMKPEFLGSVLALVSAPFILYLSRLSKYAIVYVFVVSILLVNYGNNALMGFVVGAFLAAVLPVYSCIKKPCAFVLLLVGVYMLGFSGVGSGWYAIFPDFEFGSKYVAYVSVIGSSIVLFVFECSLLLKKFFSGYLSSLLGELSFPLYLLHILVIFSLGSYVFIGHGANAAVGCSFLASVVFSIPLVLVNKIWVSSLNKFLGLYKFKDYKL